MYPILVKIDLFVGAILGSGDIDGIYSYNRVEGFWERDFGED